MKVIKNFLYNISYQMLVIILPLITVPYVSGILGAEGVGDYAFTYANMQYFVIFGMIGINLYGNRQIAYIRENKEDLKKELIKIDHKSYGMYKTLGGSYSYGNYILQILYIFL